MKVYTRPLPPAVFWVAGVCALVGAGGVGWGLRVGVVEVVQLRPALVWLPEGSFWMGSPEEARGWEGDRTAATDELPRHRVMVSGFGLCETEVTQGQYEAVMGENPSACDFGCGADLPVQYVSWWEAVAYLNRLTELESAALEAEGQAGLSVCYEVSGESVRWVGGCTGYRLPTEAEWEYGARAGTETSWSWGEDPAQAGTYAWYGENSDGRVHPVRSRTANPWGLYDVHGNVWEWVWDRYGDYAAEAAVNPIGPPSGEYRVLRGGSFDVSPGNLRSALRVRFRPGHRLRLWGFRCARGPGPQP